MKTARDDSAASELRELGPVEDVTAGTRERVARAILENGRSTAADLAHQLALTPAAVRRHLDALLADGLITAAQPRGQAQRGRGRPAKTFVVTDTGRHHFFQAYDDLAASALRFLADTAGAQAVEQFAARRVAELEDRYRPYLAEAAPADRASVLAVALSADGYAASVRPAPGGAVGEQVCQHHCPVAHVAEQFPQLCEAETQAFARLLGTHVQRLATIAHGDGVCTTYVPTGRTTS
ncbi:MAG TPA: winged helix-turn-helix transcriptional regulator [Sporichthya sp.]|nr:winged helix-turn-helix transcriptional regulator [Sporichthya sp.]